MKDPGLYGKSAVEQVAAALGVSPPTLYNCRHVVEHFTPEEYDELRKRRENGFRLSFTHLVRLTFIIKARDLAKMIERAFEDRMTTKQLKRAVKDLLGPKGTPPRSIPTPVGGLTSMVKKGEEFGRSCEGLQEGVFDRIPDTDPKRVEEFLDLVDKATVAEEAVHEQVMENLYELEKARTRLQEMRDEQQEKDHSPATPGKKQRGKAGATSSVSA